MQGVRVSAITARIARVGCAEAGRATVAAGLTWQTCAALLHTPDPYAGAVAALLIVETTVVRTVGAALRYAAGCLLGVLVAVPGALYVEPAMLGLGFVVFASVLLARQGFLGHYGLHVPTTALITYALVRGRHSGELTSHLAEIVVGIAFGLACSALLCPTVRVRSAERALEDLRVLIARHLDGLADAAVRRERPRKVLGTTWEDDLDTALTRARAAVDEAHESMRWNVRPTARRRRWHLDRRVLETLTDVAGRVAATGRLLDTHPSAAGVPRPASAASGADAGFSPAHGGVTGRTSDSPDRVRAAAPERGTGSPGHPGHPGPGNTGATEKRGTGRVPTSTVPGVRHIPASTGPGEGHDPASTGPDEAHVPASTGPSQPAAPGRAPGSPGPAHTGAPVHGDPASAVCPGRAGPGTTATRGPHTHPAALDRFSPGHPAVAGGHGTAAVLAGPYARLLRTTALCVYSCRGGRPHPALPAARRAVARLGAPAAEPTGADAEDRRLLRHLDQALTRLSAPAPAPPARPARPRRTSTPLRTSLRR
ncbi:FUSC family protein [Streptomyces sp. NPDC015139]|uniref:FUSC family protein n=1 Tax=Streptomyces sp. NPDC015139 TaxID=3364942 RepID=UPI003700AE4C